MTIDYVAHLSENSDRFVAVLADAAADVQVPTCPDWRTDDLLWHLTEVQWFWGRIVDQAVDDPQGLAPPQRPPDRAGLVEFFGEATTLLRRALRDTDPAEPRWTWAEDRTAGFIRRRQTHEALIHRIDAELTADVERIPVDAELATDGVDEALRIMFGGAPPWARVRPVPGHTVRVRTADTGTSWHVTLARLDGTSPEGETYTDESVLVVADHDAGDPVAAAVEGAAADLDCWLWGRPTSGALHRTGDEQVLLALQNLVSEGVD